MGLYLFYSFILLIINIYYYYKSIREGLIFTIIILVFFQSTLPFEMSEQAGLTTKITYVFFFIAFIYSLLKRNPIYKVNLIFIGLLLSFIVYMFINLPINPTAYGEEKLLNFVIRTLFPIIVLSRIGPYNTKDLRVVVKAILLGSSLTALKLFFYGDLSLARVTYTEVNPISIGRELGLGVTIGITMLVLDYRKRLQLYLYVLTLLFFMLLTGSKGPILSTLIAMLFAYFIKRKSLKINVKKQFGKLFLFLIALTTIVFNAEIFKGMPSISRVLHGFLDFGEGSSEIARLKIIKISTTSFYDKPFLGIGTGDFIKYSANYFYPHNLFLEILTEQGIFGFVLFLLLISWVLPSIKSILTENNFEGKVLIALFVYLFINAQFSMDIASNNLVFILVIIIINSSLKYRKRTGYNETY